jgi:uncharacterized iron-regulated membrane protein
MLRKSIGKIHLVLGFTSGVIIFIIAITGCLYAFQEEIRNLTETFRFVEQRNDDFLPPSVLKEKAENLLPGKHIHAVAYSKKTEAAQVIFFSFDPEYYYIVFINPYTGDVLKVKNMEADFFHFVLDGHFYLWLPPQIGQPVVASATLVFVIMLISGMVLWWPRKKKDIKQRLRVKWNSKWRRKNYDLHNVPGFYISLIALIFALTGLVWGFQWFANGAYSLMGGEKSLVYADPLSDTTHHYQDTIPSIDKVYYRMREEYSGLERIEVHVPAGKNFAIAANANEDPETYWKIDYRYYDQHTLKEISVDHIYGRFPEAKAADKMIRLNYDIHTGAIMGLPGKIIAFGASLVCATLPVTGFSIWWGRRNKKKGKAGKRRSEKKLVATTLR